MVSYIRIFIQKLIITLFMTYLCRWYMIHVHIHGENIDRRKYVVLAMFWENSHICLKNVNN